MHFETHQLHQKSFQKPPLASLVSVELEVVSVKWQKIHWDFNVLFNDLLNLEETHECDSSRPSIPAYVKAMLLSIHVDGRKENNHFCDTPKCLKK